MNFIDSRRSFENFSIEAICTRILKKHRHAVSVQKPHLAVANLARIIEAALKLSNRQGFHATTLRQLATASNLSMGGLYSYIENKDTLLLMILDGVSSTVNEVLSEAPESLRRDPWAHLQWLIDAHIRLTEILQPWFVFAYLEAKSFPRSSRKMAVNSEEATEAIFAAVIEQGVRHGAFYVDDPNLAASLIKPLLQDWYVKRGKYRRKGIGVDAYIAAVSSFVRSALTGRKQSPGASRLKQPRKQPGRFTQARI